MKRTLLAIAASLIFSAAVQFGVNPLAPLSTNITRADAALPVPPCVAPQHGYCQPVVNKDGQIIGWICWCA